jgi:hypothetical protein
LVGNSEVEEYILNEKEALNCNKFLRH